MIMDVYIYGTSKKSIVHVKILSCCSYFGKYSKLQSIGITQE